MKERGKKITFLALCLLESTPNCRFISDGNSSCISRNIVMVM